MPEPRLKARGLWTFRHLGNGLALIKVPCKYSCIKGIWIESSYWPSLASDHLGLAYVTFFFFAAVREGVWFGLCCANVRRAQDQAKDVTFTIPKVKESTKINLRCSIFLVGNMTSINVCCTISLSGEGALLLHLVLCYILYKKKNCWKQGLCIVVVDFMYKFATIFFFSFIVRSLYLFAYKLIIMCVSSSIIHLFAPPVVHKWLIVFSSRNVATGCRG